MSSVGSVPFYCRIKLSAFALPQRGLLSATFKRRAAVASEAARSAVSSGLRGYNLLQRKVKILSYVFPRVALRICSESAPLVARFQRITYIRVKELSSFSKILFNSHV